jgi:hypothetical protein
MHICSTFFSFYSLTLPTRLSSVRLHRLSTSLVLHQPGRLGDHQKFGKWKVAQVSKKMGEHVELSTACLEIKHALLNIRLS